MKLSRVERWILSNQYRILEQIYPNEADSLARQRRVLEEGFELEYNWIAQHIYEDQDTLSSEECKEVIQILSMFSAIKRTYEALDDKSGIDEWTTKFAGFDGNTETSQLAYARHFCEGDGGRFKDLDRGDALNSHAPALDAYRRLLGEWEQSQDKINLSKDDLIRITREYIHPDNR